jgi:hypothetical protein
VTLKVILEVPSDSWHQAREEVHRRYRLDYTDLLQMTLIHWEELQSNDDEVLKAALEGYMRNRWPKRRQPQGYSDLMEALHLMATALSQFHRALEPILTVFLKCRGLPPEKALMKLVGWCDGAPIVAIDPQPIPVLNLNPDEV